MIQYLAGIFDAEGYVRIRKSVANKEGGHSYQAEVKIYMCDKRIIEEFAKLYNLTIKSNYRGIDRKLAYYVSIGNNLLKSTTFIDDFLPFLNEKRTQLQEVKNLLLNLKDKEKCYQDYMLAKESFFHPILNTPSYKYLAGIIDGDGWFSIFNCGKIVKSFNNRFSVGLEQRYKPMIDYMASLFGDSVLKTKTLDRIKHNQTYSWYCSTFKILPFLENIYPYLIEKKERCEVLIDYIKSQKEYIKIGEETLEKWKKLK